MEYRPSTRVRTATAAILCILFVGLLTRPYWDTAKEKYFLAVFGRCADANDLANRKWKAPSGTKAWFDAWAREFVPVDAAGMATVACTKRWAGFVIDEASESAHNDGPMTHALRVVVSGQTVSPPQHLVAIESFTVTPASDQ